jgi:hypothetical protein
MACTKQVMALPAGGGQEPGDDLLDLQPLDR